MGKFNRGPGARTCDDCPASRGSVSAGTTTELACTACTPGRSPRGPRAVTRAPWACSAAVGRKFVRRLPGRQGAQSHRHVRRARMHGLRPMKVSTQACADTAAVSRSMFSGGLGSSSCEDCPAGKYSVSPLIRMHGLAPGTFSTQASANTAPSAARAPWASSAAGWARAHAKTAATQNSSLCIYEIPINFLSHGQ
jgi:hypothetical protein